MKEPNEHRRSSNAASNVVKTSFETLDMFLEGNPDITTPAPEPDNSVDSRTAQERAEMDYVEGRSNASNYMTMAVDDLRRFIERSDGSMEYVHGFEDELDDWEKTSEMDYDNPYALKQEISEMATRVSGIEDSEISELSQLRDDAHVSEKDHDLDR